MLPTVILPGYLAGADEYGELVKNLESLTDSSITMVPLKRKDWYVTLGGRPVTPILQALKETISAVLSQSQSDQINLIGHSAGGWISRVYLGNEPYCGDRWNGLPQVAGLITLGTPHLSQERWTKRNLDFVNDTYPGAFHDEVKYTCVAGKSIFGKKTWKLGDWFTHQSYTLTCGQGDCWGDGVTPIQAAHLEGANNVTFDHVKHSPQAKNRNQDHLWYGSEPIVKEWASHLI